MGKSYKIILKYFNLTFILRSKLYRDSRLKQLHSQYKECVANTILKSFQEDKVVDGEVCLEEKQAFYTHLHENRRFEHDNLVAYMKNITGAFDESA